LHVVQANLLRVPAGSTHAEILDRWHSLVDIAEIAAAGGTRVTVVQASDRAERIARNGIEYRFVALPGPPGTRERGRRLAASLAELGADLLHVQGLAFAADAFAVARRLPQLPILCQDHADRPPRWWRTRAWKRWYTAVSAVAFTAEEQALPFVDAGVFGAAMPVFAIPESSSRFTPGDQGHARAASGLHGDPCVAWVGHLDRNKDPLAVVDGIARAAHRLPGLQLWCAFGSAPLLPEVKAMVHAHPHLEGRVHLLGRLPHAQIQTMMRAADVFVSGSHREGSGYALLEALACGAMPIATDIPPFRAVTGGIAGRLWPPGDASGFADALVDAWSRPVSRATVRSHFDAHLSFAAVGRRWAHAYARTRELHARAVHDGRLAAARSIG
jgi:glycosyltransferase involved in cell wall biosynthesis